MEPINPSSSKLLNDIITGLRLRYATLNDGIPRPMLNSPVREGTADAELLVKRVTTRLDAAHEANLAVPVVSTWYQRLLALKSSGVKNIWETQLLNHHESK
jgi:hypothetical protein